MLADKSEEMVVLEMNIATVQEDDNGDGRLYTLFHSEKRSELESGIEGLLREYSLPGDLRLTSLSVRRGTITLVVVLTGAYFFVKDYEDLRKGMKLIISDVKSLVKEIARRASIGRLRISTAWKSTSPKPTKHWWEGEMTFKAPWLMVVIAPLVALVAAAAINRIPPIPDTTNNDPIWLSGLIYSYLGIGGLIGVIAAAVWWYDEFPPSRLRGWIGFGIPLSLTALSAFLILASIFM